jgi:hypothetical protein
VPRRRRYQADSPEADAKYVACVAPYAYDTDGPNDAAAVGRNIAIEISSGVRTVAEEQEHVYDATPPSISQLDARAMVNCATVAYLHYNVTGG